MLIYIYWLHLLCISSLRFQNLVRQYLIIFRRGKTLFYAFSFSGISTLLSQLSFITIVLKMLICNLNYCAQYRVYRTYDDLSQFFVIFLVLTTFCQTLFLHNINQTSLIIDNERFQPYTLEMRLTYVVHFLLFTPFMN